MKKSTKMWRDFLNNWDTNLVSVGGITIGVISLILGFLNLVNIPLVLSLTLSMLGVLAVSVRRDRQSVKKDQSLKAFQQEEAYRFLIDVINQYGAKEAVLFQYSSTTSAQLIRFLLSRGARVTVFIQHEEEAANIGSQIQANHIKTAVKIMHGYLRRNPTRSDQLKIYKIRTPSTVSAVKIDDRVICMGPYTYEWVDHTDPAAHEHYGNDTVEISGHDNATLIAWEGTSEFEVFDKTFSRLEKNYRCNAEEVSL